MATGNQPASYYIGGIFRFQPDGSVITGNSVTNSMDKMVMHRNTGDTIFVAAQGYDNTFNHQPANQMITVAKLGPGGQPITSFGLGGSVSFHIPLGMAWHGGHPTAITTQADGKIVLTITVNTFFPYTMVIRLLPDGQFDSTFGQAGVKEVLIGACGYIANRIFPIAGNKLLITGNFKATASAQHYSALRLQYNGDYDSSYGTNGYVTTLPGLSGEVYGSAIEPDGKLVLAGMIGGGANLYAAIIRYTEHGILDQNFGNNGILHSTSNNRYAAAIQRGTLGRYYVLGRYTPNNGQTWNWYLNRLKINGSTDSSFNGVGQFNFGLPSSDNRIKGLSLLPDGKILAFGDYRPGFSNWNIYFARLLTKPWITTVDNKFTYCAGDTASLIYYGVGRPQWYYNNVQMSDTTRSISTTFSGSYFAVSESSQDTSNQVSLLFHALPQPVIQLSGDSLIVNDLGNFSWYNAIDSSLITDTSGASFHPDTSGSFFVKQIDTNGCIGYSPVFQYSMLSTKEKTIKVDRLMCWPNPTSGKLNISHQSLECYLLKIYLVTGQLISTYTIPPGITNIDLKKLATSPNSLLILHFMSTSSQVNFKVLLQ